MTPKEKAEQLIHNFFPSLKYSLKLELVGIRKKYAKQCALIAVDEILDASLYYFDEFSPYVIYWQQVKKEIWLIT